MSTRSAGRTRCEHRNIRETERDFFGRKEAGPKDPCPCCSLRSSSAPEVLPEKRRFRTLFRFSSQRTDIMSNSKPSPNSRDILFESACKQRTNELYIGGNLHVPKSLAALSREDRASAADRGL
ncbi:hypothetical protein CgunFtcFv8_016994 [Champsocephalus gunnari]|uniref:Uncharacterized protein n=1 Tax=Champsocephalus gunnari TaxID=52237 RepID=A0AAN8CRN4_CHAGU|nr:hypothetical protein CgunFtcFv8_016994 [Champsocephalus gunnari]